MYNNYDDMIAPQYINRDGTHMSTKDILRFQAIFLGCISLFLALVAGFFYLMIKVGPYAVSSFNYIKPFFANLF